MPPFQVTLLTRPHQGPFLLYYSRRRRNLCFFGFFLFFLLLEYILSAWNVSNGVIAVFGSTPVIPYKCVRVVIKITTVSLVEISLRPVVVVPTLVVVAVLKLVPAVPMMPMMPMTMPMSVNMVKIPNWSEPVENFTRDEILEAIQLQREKPQCVCDV